MFEGNSEEEDFNTIPRQFAEQISQEAFETQKRVYTKSAVSDLQKSKEYKEWHQRCSSCGSSWFNGQWSSQCRECGGFSMIRSCAICNGHCGSTWYRDVDMSHRMKEGYWNGKCNLPESEQTHFILQNFVDNKEDTLIEAFGDLGKR
ncbi:uncharacterized protein [Apostichopus japonicus]|uniref:uncharacterized protein n=1 Tax=Stichopus japonicus TaxID=307972 RepID=UPI003AB32402